jgi:diguanylate cyclase (GGDEF)-like protein
MTNLYPAEYVSTFKTNLANVFNGSPTKFEIDYVGEHYEHFVSPIFDQQNEVVEIIGFATNITDRRIADEQSKYLASHDALTGLMNRVTFEENVKMQIDKEPNSTYAIMFLDLDKFKALNDTFGHIAGDLALQEVSTRLIQGISSYAGGFVARMGGDEFAIFLPYTKKQHIISLTEALILSISKPYLLKENTASLGVSIGIALYQEDSSVYKQLIHFSDMAMYEAKTTADCNYKFFEKDFLL